MKYSESNKPLVCMMTQSTCYQNTRKMAVRGVLWHSTGANNPNLKRYVQPSDDDPRRAELLALLGVNQYGNDWNHIERDAGLNAWIGKLADGSVAAVQAMPWDFRPWGCGAGRNGSCNNGWIQFEICEDALTDPDYFERVYREGVELTAYLCRLYGLDPRGTVDYNGIAVPTVLCHADSHALGLGSNHGDVLYWFGRFGKSMDDVRNDVSALLAGEEPNGENGNMDSDRFGELWTECRRGLQNNNASVYSAEARAWAISNGLIQGGEEIDGRPNYMWYDLLTREQFVTVLYRFAQMRGLAERERT